MRRRDFEGVAIGHPLLPGDSCVRNDLTLSGENPVLIISGSNMSGKSTLLRSVGINTVLGLAGAPVCANELRLSPVVIGASIRLQDSLLEGSSRFYAEILRLRQITELSQNELPVMFLLDEISERHEFPRSGDRRRSGRAETWLKVARSGWSRLTTSR